jgi:hypothetical protein
MGQTSSLMLTSTGWIDWTGLNIPLSVGNYYLFLATSNTINVSSTTGGLGTYYVVNVNYNNEMTSACQTMTKDIDLALSFYATLSVAPAPTPTPTSMPSPTPTSTPTPTPTPTPTTTALSVASNCTVTAVNYKSISGGYGLYITVTKNGNIALVQATISKNTLAKISSLKVYINNSQKTYSYVDNGSSWIISTTT